MEEQRKDIAEAYNCECLECGYIFQTDQHCRDVKCPKCGGAMRRAERPGVGAEGTATLYEPFPNEHSARLKDPEMFDEFRRTNNKFGDGIHAVWGRRKEDHAKWDLQAIRFDATKWTVAAAKKWLKNNGHEPIRFEPATKGGKENMTTEKAVAVHRPPKAPANTPWDAAAAQKRVVAKYGEETWLECCAYIDPDIDGVTAGKLPHHDVVDNKLCVVWDGVRAVIQVLGGARGGVKGIPASEMQGVKRHIEVHADQFDKTVPWKKDSVANDRLVRMTQQIALAEMLAAHLLEREGTSPVASSKLLVEVFQPAAEHFQWEDVVDEATGEPKGLLRIKAMVQQTDTPNKNRRIYPFDILRRETEKLNAKAERGKQATLLDHPPVSLFVIVGERLWDACGRLCRTWMDGKEVWAEFLVEYQENAKGRHLYSLIKTGLIPGVSSRGSGNTRSEEKDGTTFDVICDDYCLYGYDFVSNESVEGAEIKTINMEQTALQPEQEGELEMTVEELREITQASIEPVMSAIETLRKDYVPKAERDASIKEKDGQLEARDQEIERLKNEAAEKDTKIADLEKTIEENKPPETLTDEAVAEKVEENEPYRADVLRVLSTMKPTEETFEDSITKAREIVTDLLKREVQGDEHGEPTEREPVESPTEPPKETGEVTFRKRGKEVSDELKTREPKTTQ